VKLGGRREGEVGSEWEGTCHFQGFSLDPPRVTMTLFTTLMTRHVARWRFVFVYSLHIYTETNATLAVFGIHDEASRYLHSASDLTSEESTQAWCMHVHRRTAVSQGIQLFSVLSFLAFNGPAVRNGDVDRRIVSRYFWSRRCSCRAFTINFKNFSIFKFGPLRAGPLTRLYDVA